MNKKIKLLAKQAKIDYELREEIARAPVWIATDEELEKFAELLIKDIAMFSMVITDDHYDVAALYRHFGVEE